MSSHSLQKHILWRFQDVTVITLEDCFKSQAVFHVYQSIIIFKARYGLESIQRRPCYRRDPCTMTSASFHVEWTKQRAHVICMDADDCVQSEIIDCTHNSPVKIQDALPANTCSGSSEKAPHLTSISLYITRKLEVLLSSLNQHSPCRMVRFSFFTLTKIVQCCPHTLRWNLYGTYTGI